MSELSKKYQEYQAKLTEIRDQSKKLANKVFRECSQDLFDKYPDLNRFGWVQYTPYFNDGDVCEFGVRAEDYYLTINNCDNYDDSLLEETGFTNEETLQECIQDVSNLVYSFNEEDLEHLFGDHVRVIVNRNGQTEQEEYDHD